MIEEKVILPGGAGLVGQNVIVKLKEIGCKNIVVLDKHPTNLNIVRKMHPDVTAIEVDLADEGDWMAHFEGASSVVILQAQIGGIDAEQFQRNNVDATANILKAIKKYDIQHTVHISSSVVKSVADDLYTRSKTEQENIVVKSGIPTIVLRPTLMFGWFDRKHLGWLSRFMSKVPIFPIPGNGKFMRQPLYAGDFSDIIVSCIKNKKTGGIFNISGQEKVDYIDIIRQIKRSTSSRSIIICIPYTLFHVLLKIWGAFDKNPPFTTSQLEALIADDEFEVIDWPTIFEIEATKFSDAVDETFNDPHYSQVTLDF
ncbi:NAD-dependent epimerase/dehydratase family protein [Vibrio cholerae]|uniref:NAD-dependent epimerase/dehydratase family protein n=2 Tax=Vibrio cholerae TaxID=666 RepID=UPI0002734723|nr:NAD-dependent epimerase/dehydratase family protein [Vibrio cholerae]EGR4428532.1 NAD-dependent epimerase/dehydratase family protein [Vibrio cholerae]EJH65805.1 NAD dependent epimerase/dehydratase family protein [Vibrio cholerae HE-25]EJL6313753.1 NAD-dependent epimerase/dehydratase family protein [Vibrio cholerae]MBF8949112.1 NAD-dependent epimerase/dehydratase family protein [Vibrio cholerae]MBF8956666.1 NAD-dependent epimerase/dehydratase family protein [Vibrio cholerae]